MPTIFPKEPLVVVDKKEIPVKELRSIFQSNEKYSVLLAVPGAFTPGCSKVHLPGYIEKFDTLKSLKVDKVYVVSVNDGFVMDAWKRDQLKEKFEEWSNEFVFIADIRGELTKSLHMEADYSKTLGNTRSKRYSMLIKNGEILTVNEDVSGQIKNSAVDIIIAQLQSRAKL